MKDQLKVNFSIEAVEAAASNAASLEDIVLEIPVANPNKFSLDMEIFGITLVPITDAMKDGRPDVAISVPNTTKCCALQRIVVNNLSNTVKDGYITVNGGIDIPREGGRQIGVEEAYFASEEHARAICEVLTEVQLQRAKKALDEKQEEVDFLLRQKEDGRY